LAESALDRGDAAWARRSERFVETGELAVEQLQIAIDAYEQALQEDPSNLTLHFKLMDALYYMAFFVAETKTERRPFADRAIELNQLALQVLVDRVGREKLGKAQTPEAQAELLKQDPQARYVHLWCDINWGLFSMSHGNLAAARHNVARKIRDHSEMVILLDDQFWDGGGYRLLGRLHTNAPIVPGFTGWVDRAYGILLSRKANAISTRDLRNPLFLAEALLKFQPEHEEETLEILEELSHRQPGGKRPVEEAYYINKAKEILDEMKRRRAQKDS
jgi:tetratricopeptide (TPR) repeat protein